MGKKDKLLKEYIRLYKKWFDEDEDEIKSEDDVIRKIRKKYSDQIKDNGEFIDNEKINITIRKETTIMHDAKPYVSVISTLFLSVIYSFMPTALAKTIIVEVFCGFMIIFMIINMRDSRKLALIKSFHEMCLLVLEQTSKKQKSEIDEVFKSLDKAIENANKTLDISYKSINEGEKILKKISNLKYINIVGK